MTAPAGTEIDRLIGRMRRIEAELRAAQDARAYFHATYLRTTQAVRDALAQGGFLDPAWVERWVVAFAALYLGALDASRTGGRLVRPWAIAFDVAARRPELPALRHVLLGMNAHVNYDLPQALLAVISDPELDDPGVVRRRAADHHRIDAVLAARVGAEDAELQRAGVPRSRLDRALTPLNRRGTVRFLHEARAKVWANAVQLSHARRRGPEAYARRLAELEALSGAKVAELVAPGQVLLRLTVHGFGVRLAPVRDPVAVERAGAPPAPGLTSAGAPRARSSPRADTPHARLAFAPRPARGPRSFDPVQVGVLETRVWAAYYRREWARFLADSIRAVRAGFGMSWPRTLRGAWLVLRANQLWAPYPDNDPEGARRCMRRFYVLVGRSGDEMGDPAEAARLEVAWWGVHRAAQYDPAAVPPGELEDALSRLYAYVYGAPAADVRPAAVHRVAAMRLSDRWVAEGRGADSPLLAEARATLVRSYAALLAAVHR